MEIIYRPKKHGVKRRIIGIIAVAALLYFGYRFYQPPQLKQTRFTFSYGETIPTDSQAYFTYGMRYDDTKFDSRLFTMKEIGEYEVEVDFAQQHYTLNIAIVDKHPPTITFFDQDPLILYEYQDRIITENLWQIDDESDVSVQVSPTLAQIKDGKQKICVRATDAFDNTNTKCETYTVKKQTLDLPKFPDVGSVEELVTRYIRQKGLSPATFAFFYESLPDGESYRYNADQAINAASTIKVPLNMLYEDAYAQKTMDPQDRIIFIPSDMEVGGGELLQKHRPQEALTYAYLQEQSLEYSDNTATNMLVRGLGGFSRFRQLLKQYSTAKLPAEFDTQNVVTMNYMGDVMKKLYQQRNHYAKIIEYMKHAAEGEFLKASTDVFTIAQKYGQYQGFLHVVGIVYTPKPYIVGIYTMNRVDGEALIQELNQWLLAYQLLKQ